MDERFNKKSATSKFFKQTVQDTVFTKGNFKKMIKRSPKKHKNQSILTQEISKNCISFNFKLFCYVKHADLMKIVKKMSYFIDQLYLALLF